MESVPVYVEAVVRHFVNAQAAGGLSRAGLSKMANSSRINSGNRQSGTSAAFERNGGCAGPRECGAALTPMRLAEYQEWTKVLSHGGRQVGEVAADIVQRAGILIDDDL